MKTFIVALALFAAASAWRAESILSEIEEAYRMVNKTSPDFSELRDNIDTLDAYILAQVGASDYDLQSTAGERGATVKTRCGGSWDANKFIYDIASAGVNVISQMLTAEVACNICKAKYSCYSGACMIANYMNNCVLTSLWDIVSWVQGYLAGDMSPEDYVKAVAETLHKIGYVWGSKCFGASIKRMFENYTQAFGNFTDNFIEGIYKSLPNLLTDELIGFGADIAGALLLPGLGTSRTVVKWAPRLARFLRSCSGLVSDAIGDAIQLITSTFFTDSGNPNCKQNLQNLAVKTLNVLICGLASPSTLLSRAGCGWWDSGKVQDNCAIMN